MSSRTPHIQPQDKSVLCQMGTENPVELVVVVVVVVVPVPPNVALSRRLGSVILCRGVLLKIKADSHEDAMTHMRTL